MNEREQFEAWARKSFCGFDERYVHDSHLDEEIDCAYMGWEACAESKQSELDKANARIAQLEETLRQVYVNNNEVLDILAKIEARK